MRPQSDGKLKSYAVNALARTKTPTAQEREKGGRVLTHPTEDSDVPLPPLAENLTVTLPSRQSRLSSSGRQRSPIYTTLHTTTNSVTHEAMCCSFLDSRKGFYILEDSGTYLHSRTADMVVQ